MTIVKKTTGGMIAVALISALVGLGAGVAMAGQPEMESALRALHGAQAELSKVTMNKEGHADKARQLVAEAISQVEAGIAYGKAHGL
jgi:uncharacterized protein HemX